VINGVTKTTIVESLGVVQLPPRAKKKIIIVAALGVASTIPKQPLKVAEATHDPSGPNPFYQKK
jgi:hypothetical protein